MRTNTQANLLTWLTIATAGACSFTPDSVAPSFYGAPEAGSHAASNAVTSQPSSNSQAGDAAALSRDAAGISGGSDTAVGSNSSSTSNGSSSSSKPAGQAGMTAAIASAAGSGGSSAPHAGNCDLSGHWLSVLHIVTDALGQLQVGHYYTYYEFEQKGDSFTVTKGMLCGFDAIGQGTFAVTVDFHAAWPAIMSKVSFKGRAGTSAATQGGCNVAFNKWYTVRGATVPYYLDPSTTLPTKDQQAMGSTPGWEDWDGDGNPGITGVISGVVNGKIFVAPRLWESVSATVPDVSSVFKVPVEWDQEQNVMSYDGSPLLASSAARSSNAAIQFAQLARLTASQASCDDAAICKSIIALAPMLTPEAAGN